MTGLKVCITAGPTYERIDPVRFIGNFSSGKMGFALAECASRGAEVTLVTGPVSLKTDNPHIHRVDVESATEMAGQTLANGEDADICIFAAAVADYTPKVVADHKIKREKTDTMTIELVRNPDIAREMSNCKRPGKVHVGFALETDNEQVNARNKLDSKGLDMIVLNSLRDKGAGFQTDTNKVTIITKQSEKAFSLKSKRDVAADIVNEIMNYRSDHNESPE